MELKKARTREPVFAGSFYPAENDAVVELLHKFYNNSKDVKTGFYNNFNCKILHGLIVPHAGWVYSGKTAFLAYQLLKKCKPEKIALLGPSHRQSFQGAVADNHELWETPLGVCSIINDEHFEVNRNVHAREHSLEVQMPFIYHFLPSVKILPLVVGEMTGTLSKHYARQLWEENYFLIISTDLSHFYPLEVAKQKDAKTIENIEEVQENGVVACGINPLRIAFAFMHEHGFTPHLIDYSTSAEASGDTTSVVGYASFWF